MADLFGFKTAKFSPCRRYRYALWRWWDKSKPYVLFIGLNPSTANETEDDPTIRRCIGFARDWGFGGLCMVNLFAFRTSDPQIMQTYREPVGSENNYWLRKLAAGAGEIIAAWGTHGNFKNRANEVIVLLPPVKCLGTTQGGQPKHPLYLAKNTERQDF